jgi:hypothetical protein
MRHYVHQLSTFCRLQLCIGYSDRNSRSCLCGQNINKRNKNQPKTFERGSATTKTTNKPDANMNITDQIDERKGIDYGDQAKPGVTAGSLNADVRPPVNILPIHANAGVTAVLTNTSETGVFIATATGVVQTSLLGTCVANAQLNVRFSATPGQPVVLNGTGSFTSIDGTKSLQLSVSGTANPDPANPNFFNAKYQLTFTGGTGAFASASGVGEITEVVMFTSQTTATFTWTLNGLVITPK